jgi:hypothetical protein
MSVNIYSEIMNIEFLQGADSHTSNWAKFYVKGLDKWRVRETDGEPSSDHHANYQQYVCLDVPENTVFTVFEQSGDKRGTSTFNFFICKASFEPSEITADYERYCRGNFEVICEGLGKTKAPRLMDWWLALGEGRKRKELLAYAEHCKQNIDRRGVKELPVFNFAPIVDAIASIEIAEPPIEIAAPIVEPVAEQLQLVEIAPTVRREYIDPARVNLNLGTQSRAESQEKIAQYTDAIATGEWDWERSDIILFEDLEGNLFPSDGHHRIKAALAAGSYFLAEIRSGSLRDAIFESFASNRFHGLPLTHQDKNNRVNAILLDSEWQCMSDRSIATHCGVSAPFVGNLRSNLIAKNDIAPTPTRNGKDGRTTKPKTSSTKSKSAAAPKIDSPLEPIIEVAIAPVSVKPLVNAVAIVDEELLAAKKRQDAIVKHLNNTESIESGSLTSAKQAVNVLTYQELLEISAYINELIPVM